MARGARQDRARRDASVREGAPAPVALEASTRRQPATRHYRGILRFPVVRQLIRFSGVGVVCTAASLALYALLRPWLGAQLANAVALVVTSLLNVQDHRAAAAHPRPPPRAGGDCRGAGDHRQQPGRTALVQPQRHGGGRTDGNDAVRVPGHGRALQPAAALDFPAGTPPLARVGVHGLQRLSAFPALSRWRRRSARPRQLPPGRPGSPRRQS